MSLSTLLARVPVRPLPVQEFLDRLNSRKVRTAEQAVLPNGLTVVTVRGGAPHSYVGLFSKAGSRFENRKNHPRGLAMLSNRALAQLFENRKWLVSSHCDREHASISLESAVGTTGGAIKAIGEVLSGGTIGKDSVERLLPQLFNETAAYRSAKARVVEDEVLNNVYASTGLGNSPYPWHQADFDKFTVGMVNDHVGLYDPANSVLVAVGDVHPSEVESAALAHLGTLSASNVRNVEQGRFLGGYAGVRTEEHEAHTGVAYEAPPITHTDAPAFVLLPHCIGSYFDRSLGQYGADTWDARRLTVFPFVHEHREAYMGFEDTGVFYFSTRADVEHGTNGQNQNQITYHASDAICRFQRVYMDEEFDRAKARCLQQLASKGGDSAQAIGSEVGKSVLHHGRHISLGEVMSRVAYLAKREFQEAIARHMFHGNPCAFSIGSDNNLSYQYDSRDAELTTWRNRD
eukprot:TRINITY_DN33949_c0_g1_i1.p1 TRINITY_DN33949_c0_g1~~TRINITY_DN33949_c0_g1_i1.p1  ORF type:complete len:460 (+),score=108.84 TRINITY_DN33949_c0_g1_i1:91-1470(+)